MSALFVFDAYGTLFDVHAAVARSRESLGPSAGPLSELWRTKQLEYSWVRSMLGRYQDFWTLTEAALDYAAARCGGLTDAQRATLLSAYADLDAHPDALSTLAGLRAAGARIAILSNATVAMLQRAIGAAGLAGEVDALLSIDSLRVYKTDPRAYGLVTERFGCAPHEVTFVSSNRWDVAGAAAFGFEAIWVNRSALPDEYPDLPPARVVSTLSDLIGP